MHILHLKGVPILKQLQLEEALLRLEKRNFCLINEGSPPAIVMGMSGKEKELIDRQKLKKIPLPIIRRFSGGGTVVVDENTLFISLVCQNDLHPFPPYPEPIMRWTEELYKEILSPLPFSLKENDYVLNRQKIGGNAQYLQKGRFIHHTTFLWDYNPSYMQLLLHPKRTPKYRKGRSHEEFVTRLSQHHSSKKGFISDLKEILRKRYGATPMDWEELLPLRNKPHRKNTQLVIG